MEFIVNKDTKTVTITKEFRGARVRDARQEDGLHHRGI